VFFSLTEGIYSPQDSIPPLIILPEPDFSKRPGLSSFPTGGGEERVRRLDRTMPSRRRSDSFSKGRKRKFSFVRLFPRSSLKERSALFLKVTALISHCKSNLRVIFFLKTGKEKAPLLGKGSEYTIVCLPLCRSGHLWWRSFVPGRGPFFPWPFDRRRVAYFRLALLPLYANERFPPSAAFFFSLSGVRLCSP